MGKLQEPVPGRLLPSAGKRALSGCRLAQGLRHPHATSWIPRPPPPSRPAGAAV